MHGGRGGRGRGLCWVHWLTGRGSGRGRCSGRRSWCRRGCGRRGRRRRSGRGCRWRVGLTDELNIKDEVCLGRDHGWSADLTVGKLVRDEQPTLSTNVHALKTGVPAHDDAMGAVRKGDGLLSGVVVRGVELLPIGRPAGVPDGVELLRRRSLTGANLDVDVPQGVERLGGAGDHRDPGWVVGRISRCGACGGAVRRRGGGVSWCARSLGAQGKNRGEDQARRDRGGRKLHRAFSVGQSGLARKFREVLLTQGRSCTSLPKMGKRKLGSALWDCSLFHFLGIMEPLQSCLEEAFEVPFCPVSGCFWSGVGEHTSTRRTRRTAPIKQRERRPFRDQLRLKGCRIAGNTGQ